MNGLVLINSQRDHYDQVFEKLALNGASINALEFQECVFKQCDLSEAAIANKIFVDCRFEDCNLSNARLTASTLNDVHFCNCKIMGVLFNECQDRLFNVQFTASNLDYASFYGKKMIKTHFEKCSLKEANFTAANLTSTMFTDCNLLDAVFRETNLQKADLSSAYNFVIDPELNDIKQAVFSSSGVLGLLTRHQIKVV